MNKFILFLIAVMWLLTTTLLADENRFIQYRSVDGLSFNNVDYLAEDDEGYIYASTLFGLNIFDGSNFLIFNQNNTALFSNKVTSVLPIKKGFVLIATLDKGLFLYNKYKEIIIPIRTEVEEREIVTTITSLILDKDDNVWIGSEKGVLYCIALNDIFSSLEQNTSADLTKVIQLKGSIHALACIEDVIFVGDESSVITRVRQVSAKFIIDQPLRILNSNKTYVFSIYKETLLIGTNIGLFRAEHINKLDYNSIEYLSRPWRLDGKIIRSISSNENADWVGTEGEGLFKINREADNDTVEKFIYSQNKKSSINSNYILCSLIDSKNNLWIGTWFGGLNKLDLTKDAYYFIYDENENNAFANITWSIVKEKADSYWIGTHGNGLCKYTIGDKNFKSVIHNNEVQSVSSIFHDQSLGRLYIGTWGKGIKVFNTWGMKPLKEIESIFSLLKEDRIYAITPDNTNGLWIGTFKNGLLYYNTDQRTLKSIELLSDQGLKEPDIRSILFDTIGNEVWIGSLQQGLFKLSLSSDGAIVEKRQYNNMKLSDDVVSVESLYIDSARNLWILLRNGVMVKYQDKDKPETFKSFEGLINTGITEDLSGNIWISSYQGLHLIDKDLIKTGTFLNEYSFHDVVFDSIHNVVLAASDNGLVQVNPSLDLNKQAYPTILLSELKVFNERVYPDKKIRGKVILEKRLNYSDTIILPAFSQTFSIRLNTLSFSHTQKEKIRFQLKGFEEIWNEQIGTSAIATYTNVPPGTYTLKVKVSDEYNNWNPETRELLIIKQKPWWLTNLARSVYALLLIVMVYLIYKVLKRRIVLREEFKFEKLRLSQEHELYQEKMRFFTNISHDVRTPLTLMLGPLEEMHASEELSEKFRSKTRRVLKNTKMLHNLINQVLDFRKMETDNLTLKLYQLNLNKFVHYIYTQFNDLAVSKKIDFEIIYPDQEVIIVSDPQKLESIFYNLISNAIKFTPSYGQIFLEISVNETNVLVHVRDTGVGIPESELNTVFTRFYRSTHNDNISKGTGIGLALVKSYVELLNGHITVESIPDKETTFTISWPLRADYDQFEVYETEYELKELSGSESLNDNQESSGSQKDEKIIVIDDNNDILNYLVEILSPYYKVYTASNGTDGLQLTARHQPSLVICDIMMEGIDGIEVTEKIKKNLDTSHIPVILLTAKNTVDDKIEGYEKGADAYIEKPFNKSLLLTRIKTLIEHRRLLKKKFMVFDSPVDNVSPTSTDEAFIKKVIQKIKENITDSDFSVQGLVDEMDITQDQLYRKIKALTGLSINHFIRSIRLKEAAQLLRENRLNVGEVMFQVGFNNPSYFTRSFKAEFGVTPSKFMESTNIDE